MLEECSAKPKPENAEEAEVAEDFKGGAADLTVRPGHAQMFDHRYNSENPLLPLRFQVLILIFIRVHSFAANVFSLLRHALGYRGRRRFRPQLTFPAGDDSGRQAVA